MPINTLQKLLCYILHLLICSYVTYMNITQMKHDVGILYIRINGTFSIICHNPYVFSCVGLINTQKCYINTSNHMLHHMLKKI